MSRQLNIWVWNSKGVSGYIFWESLIFHVYITQVGMDWNLEMHRAKEGKSSTPTTKARIIPIIKRLKRWETSKEFSEAAINRRKTWRIRCSRHQTEKYSRRQLSAISRSILNQGRWKLKINCDLATWISLVTLKSIGFTEWGSKSLSEVSSKQKWEKRK